jgi:D-ribose pyranase
MKRSGILHPAISHLLARLGHTDTVVVADAGLPIPAGPERIDLAFLPGLPGFLPVLEALLAEMVVEEATVAVELAERSPEMASALADRLGPIPQRTMTHTVLKQSCHGARAVIRTGECTPFANVILRSGVPF